MKYNKKLFDKRYKEIMEDLGIAVHKILIEEGLEAKPRIISHKNNKLYEMARPHRNSTIPHNIEAAVKDMIARSNYNEEYGKNKIAPAKYSDTELLQRYVFALLVYNKPCPQSEAEIDEIGIFADYAHKFLENGGTIEEIKELYSKQDPLNTNKNRKGFKRAHAAYRQPMTTVEQPASDVSFDDDDNDNDAVSDYSQFSVSSNDDSALDNDSEDTPDDEVEQLDVDSALDNDSEDTPDDEVEPIDDDSTLDNEDEDTDVDDVEIVEPDDDSALDNDSEDTPDDEVDSVPVTSGDNDFKFDDIDFDSDDIEIDEPEDIEDDFDEPQTTRTKNIPTSNDTEPTSVDFSSDDIEIDEPDDENDDINDDENDNDNETSGVNGSVWGREDADDNDDSSDVVVDDDDSRIRNISSITFEQFNDVSMNEKFHNFAPAKFILNDEGEIGIDFTICNDNTNEAEIIQIFGESLGDVFKKLEAISSALTESEESYMCKNYPVVVLLFKVYNNLVNTDEHEDISDEIDDLCSEIEDECVYNSDNIKTLANNIREYLEKS